MSAFCDLAVKGVRGFTEFKRLHVTYFDSIAFVAHAHQCVGSSAFFWSLTAKALQVPGKKIRPFEFTVLVY